MPLCSLHLVRLRRDTHRSKGKSIKEPDAQAEIHAARKAFLQQVVAAQDLDDRLVVACVVRRPVIVANRIDHVYLNATPWDLLLVFKAQASQDTSKTGSSSARDSSPPCLEKHTATRDAISAEYVVSIGIPSRIIDRYDQRTEELKVEAGAAAQGKHETSPSTSSLSNDALQTDPARTYAPYRPRTSQNLEMSPDLIDLIDELEALGDKDGLVDARGPVQQLNLLAFKKTKEDKDRYYKYGQGFGPIAKKFGGEPKLLGLVVDPTASKEQAAQSPAKRIWWDEVSLVNYHSLRHFGGMAASEEYQHINRDFRLPSLDDTTIICTQEVDLKNFRARYQAPAGAAKL